MPTLASTPQKSYSRLLKALWREGLEEPEVYLWGKDLGDVRFRGFAFTMDEHDHDSPIKPLPDRPSLRLLNELWEDQRIACVKSRQMLVSWFCVSRILHDCYRPGRRWLVTCKKEEDADALLERMWVQHRNVPELVRPKAKRSYGKLVIAHDGAESRIQAAAQNSDDPRSYTFSGIWIDEASHTDNVADLVASSGPTTMAGGKLVLTTTPNGKDYVYQLITDGGRLEL